MITAHRIKLRTLIAALRGRYTVDQLRKAFGDRSLEVEFAAIGAAAASKPLDEQHMYVWLGYEIATESRQMRDAYNTVAAPTASLLEESV